MIFSGGFYFPDGEKHFVELGDAVSDYQRPQREKAFEYVTQWRRCIDIGGHVGLFSRHFAEKFEEVVAFEPNPRNRECLKLNVPENVVVQPYGLGKERGPFKGFHTTKNSGGSFVANDPSIETPVLTEADGGFFDLDVRLLDEFAYDEVGLIKLDIQGAEVNALIGARDTILRNRPVILIEEKPLGGPTGSTMHIEQAASLLASYGLQAREKVKADRIFAFPA